MLKIVVFISGSGSNLKSLINNANNYNYKVVGVLSDRQCTGINIAIEHNIPTLTIYKGNDFYNKIKNFFEEDIDLIVLAGFLSILDEEFIDKWNKKIINIHPSLLPKYGGQSMYGLNVHSSVLKSNDTTTGATVHYVDSGIDTGPILLQESIKISKEFNTPLKLQEAVKKLEHQLLPKAIWLIGKNKLIGDLTWKEH